jgi:hypothetical protein
MSTQPDALRLANALDGFAQTPWTREEAAAELRRQHKTIEGMGAAWAREINKNNRLQAINAQMLEALQQAVALADVNVRLGLYGEPDRTPACAASYAQCVAAIASATKEQP